VAAANALNPPRPIRLHYYGSDAAHIEKTATALGAQALIKIHGTVARKKVLSALMGANVAAVITTVDASASPAEQGILTGKLFEAIGANVPVLLVSPDGSDAAQIVRENFLGAAFPGNNPDAMGAWLAKNCREDTDQIRSERGTLFSWPRLAERLAAILREWVALKK
jgi:glycosyltransferase involved in cell wall biosynthesis